MTAIAALLLSLFGTDRHGDPTPPGVVVRYGTARFADAGQPSFRRLVFHPTRDEVYATTERGADDRVLPGEPPLAPTRGWNAATGKPVFRGERGATGLVFDATGRYRAENLDTKTIRVWDERTNREVRTFRFDDRQAARAIAIHDNRLAARTESDDGREQLRFLRLSDGKPVGKPLPLHKNHVIGFADDGGTLRVFDAHEGEVRALDPEASRLTSWARRSDFPRQEGARASFSPDGTRLLVVWELGNGPCTVALFDATTLRSIARYEFPTRTAEGVERQPRGPALRARPARPDIGNGNGAVSVSPDGQFAAWQEESGQITTRHLESGREATTAARVGPAPLAFHTKGRRLAAWNEFGIVRVFDPSTGKEGELPGAPNATTLLAAVSPDGATVVAADEDGGIWAWEASGRSKWRIAPQAGKTDPDPPQRFLFDRKVGTVFAVPDSDGRADSMPLRAWSVGSGTPLRLNRGLATQPDTTFLAADSGRLVEVVRTDPFQEKRPMSLRVRQVPGGKVAAKVPLEAGDFAADGIALSADGLWAIVWESDKPTVVCSTKTGRKVATIPLQGGEAPIRAVLSGDGRLLARACDGENLDDRGGMRVELFDLTDPKEPRVVFDRVLTVPEPEPGAGPLPAIAGSMVGTAELFFTSDGRTLAVAMERLSGPDDTPRWETTLFDTRSGGPLRTFPFRMAAFFPDGKTVLAVPNIRGAERVSLEPLMWKIYPPKRPTPARLEALWQQLGEPVALDAVLELARFPADAVPFLKAKLLPEPPDPKAVAGHIGKVGSRDFAERDAATKALKAMGPAVLPALRAALPLEPTPEGRNRLEKLIAWQKSDTVAFPRLRAVEALERCGTNDARATLRAVAAASGTLWADDAARSAAR